MPTTTFNYTGSVQQYTVPNDVNEILVELYGAGANNSWEGGYVKGRLSVTPGETLYLYVGGTNSGETGGWPGGGDAVPVGNTNPSGGAGYTSIRQGGDTFSDAVAVAGGAGGEADSSTTRDGGHGGADTGETGQGHYRDADTNAYADGGGGGTQSAGGTHFESGTAPGRGLGGDGDSATGADFTEASNGPGGAGYYGGGAGQIDFGERDDGDDIVSAGGGGGGSNYDDGLARVDANERGTGNANDGQIIIYEAPEIPSGLSATMVDSNQVDLSWTDNSSDEDGFNIYRGTTSGSLSEYDSVGTNVTSYSDTGVTLGTTYYYAVTSFIDTINSDQSNEEEQLVAFTVMVWDGSEFVEGVVKYHNGTSFVHPSALSYYDGSSFNELI